MKFDIARAWKDENYRQTLSQEQLDMLPANPVGELNDTEMATVAGGYDGNGYGFGNNLGIAGSSSSSASEHRTHSFAVLCDTSLFSLNLINIPVIPIASPFTQSCQESH